MEWTVVTVLIALVGFVAALVKPIVTLTRAITTLTVTVDELKADFEAHSQSTHASRAKMYERRTLIPTQ